MHPQQAQARHLYFSQRKTQKEIAQIVGVSEKTIYNWIQLYSWHKLREAALSAPALISDNLSSQIVEFQEVIASREKGSRFPTPAETIQQAKLFSCFEKVKKYPNKGQTVQAIVNFIYYVSEKNELLSDAMHQEFEEYLKETSRSGFKPYEIESGIIPFVYESMEQFPEKENTKSETESEPENSAETLAITDTEAILTAVFQPEKSGNEFPENQQQTSGRYYAPISQHDFDTHKSLLANYQSGNNRTIITFKGQQVNKQWLEYNLFQYTLLPEERKFYPDQGHFLRNVEYYSVMKRIKKYLETITYQQPPNHASNYKQQDVHYNANAFP